MVLLNDCKFTDFLEKLSFDCFKPSPFSFFGFGSFLTFGSFGAFGSFATFSFFTPMETTAEMERKPKFNIKFTVVKKSRNAVI